MNTYSQWSKQEACFACANQVWLAVNHNASATSNECIRCPKRDCDLHSLRLKIKRNDWRTLAWASEHSSCRLYIYVFHEVMDGCKKSKYSLKACYRAVNKGAMTRLADTALWFITNSSFLN